MTGQEFSKLVNQRLSNPIEVKIKSWTDLSIPSIPSKPKLYKWYNLRAFIYIDTFHLIDTDAMWGRKLF